MIKTIFRNILLVGISVLIICGLLFFALQFTGSRTDMRNALQREAAYAEQGLMMNGTDYFDNLKLDGRVTWIDASGEILYDHFGQSDSVQEEPDLPESAGQLECPEVQNAFKDGTGSAIRNSDLINRTAMYYAMRCNDGTVLRLSRPLPSVMDVFMNVSPVLWVLVIVLIISAVLAFRAARKIVRPINEIDLDHPDMASYPELKPLIEKIQEQKMTIQEETMQREQMRREFTANVSHELKTPITSISGLSQLMAQGIVPQEKMKEFSEDIYQESVRMISLIDDIIALSKLDEEAVGPTQEDIDLYQLSEDVVSSLEQKAKEKEVTIQLSGDHAHVSGISQLLSEMITNLCDNAIKYNQPGGRVDVTISSSEEETSLSVADTGIGIPQEYQGRVFERFFRVDKNSSSGVGGTGLGLSIVKHGAKFHNANVELESEPGEGTTITLVFPAKEKTQE